MNLLPAFAQTKRADLSALENKVLCCDALELLRQLPDNSVDVIITDPPYGVNKATWDCEFPTDWIQEAWRVTSKMLVMSGNTALIEAGSRIGRYKDLIILHTTNGMTRSVVSFGNFIPVLVLGDWTWKARQNHYLFPIQLNEVINHPSPKPLSAIEWLIDRYTEPTDIILDPFMGSGTTAVAARNLGRRFIGCDLSQEYVNLANTRLANTDPYQHTTLPDGSKQLSLFADIA